MNSIFNQFLQQLLPVFNLKCLRNENLNDAKAEVVSRQLDKVIEDLLKDELPLLLLEALNDVLDDVSALLVGGQEFDVGLDNALEILFLFLQID